MAEQKYINATITIILISIVTFFSIVLVFRTGVDSRTAQLELASTLKSLLNKNDSLQNQLIKANRSLISRLDQTKDTLAN
jgi:hypothetical protein